ncbi:MAG: hypothetical protein ACHP65_09900 [Legionellales bacterium]
MRAKLLLLTIVMMFYGIARADVQSENSCYFYTPRPDDRIKPIHFALRTYFDTDLKKEVGAFVQYNNSKAIIPLVYFKYVPTDTDDPGLGNYEIYRLEIVGKKITGEYMFAQTGAGNQQGKYVRYTNFRTGEKISLQYTSGDEPDCKIVN